MASSLQCIVTKELDGVQIKHYMIDTLKLSGRFTRKASKEQRIKVNRKTVKLDYILKSGDEIEIIVKKEESQNITPEDIKINVIYEDEDLLVVDKPPFMLVHPTPNNPNGTLSNAVLYHFQKNNENCIVRLVSRLDRDTSGLVIIAKNTFCHMNLSRAMNENKIIKSYLAIVHGDLIPSTGTIDLPIGKSDIAPIKRMVCQDGQRSITHYKTIEKYKDSSLVELTLETGRTHQIRVHLSHIGNPIYGDLLYGKDEQQYINRQALHAYRLVFPHPRTRQSIELVSELPSDMKELADKINKNSP